MVLRPSRMITTRHLHYRVFPIAQNGTWRWNVRRLLRSWDLFNGQKIIGIATQEHNAAYQLDSPAAVKQMFAGRGCEFIEVRNNRSLREVMTFMPMLEVIATRTSDVAAVFFGHTKGVTRQFDSRSAVSRWAQMLYDLALDYWPVVATRLQRFPAVGPFKKTGKCFAGSRSAWHYAGSFYWLRADDLFSKEWRRIDRTEYGSETYPSIHFTANEAAGLGWTAPAHEMNLYHLPHVVRAEKEVVTWKRRHLIHRFDIGR